MSEQEKPESSKIENAEQNNHAQSDKAVESVPKMPPPPPPTTSKLIKTKRSTLWWMLLVLIVGITIILWAWRIGPFHTAIEQTDNSYVKGKTTILSSQINGYINGTSAQTADVSITSSQLRHLNIFHCVLAFIFNTVILAVAINVAASLIGFG